MKRKENQIRADALHRELIRSEKTMHETRGILLMAAGYVRSQSTLDYTPSSDELDYVAYALEQLDERLAQERNDLENAASLAMAGLALPKPPNVPRQPPKP